MSTLYIFWIMLPLRTELVQSGGGGLMNLATQKVFRDGQESVNTFMLYSLRGQLLVVQINTSCFSQVGFEARGRSPKH